MDNDELSLTDIAFKYGKKLANNSVKVDLSSSLDATTGKVAAAAFTITYVLDPRYVISPKTPNLPQLPPVTGNYHVNYDEVGYAGNADLAKGDLANSELSITFQDSQAYLNVKIPLKPAIKRDSINVILLES